MKNENSREWVKNAAIVFLLIMLVLTFFSNTIMNRTLPEVAVQRIDSGSITAKVRGTGKVESEGIYEVKAESTRTIGSVLIKAGQDVKAGDVLFILGDGTSKEIAEATEKLRQLQLNYQKAAIGAPYSNYTIEEVQLERAIGTMNSITAQLEQAITAYYEAYDAYEAGIPEYLKNEIAAAQAEVEGRRAILDRAYEDYNKRVETAQQNYVNAIEALNTILANAPGIDAPEEVREAHAQQRENAEKEIGAAELALKSLQPEKDPDVQTAEKAFRDAESELAFLQSQVPGMPSDAEIKDLQDRYQKAEDDYNKIYVDLQRQQASDGKAGAMVGLEMRDIAYQIEEAKTELEKLTGGLENQILAKTGGKISTVDIKAGSTPQAGDILATIEVPDLGYTLSFTCTNDQAKRLHIGDTATVSNYYWGSKITATLSSIRTDPKNPQTNKLLTFDLTGDLTTGSDLTISVGSKSASYDIIVPNSAIRSDSNGSFVLKIEAKNSTLGNRYFARRVAVNVIASDDLNSAVTGELGAGDFVITTSGLPVAANDQVRLANTD